MGIKEIEEFLKSELKAYCQKDQALINHLRTMALNLLNLLKASDLYKGIS